jgi:hypothetical protein
MNLWSHFLDMGTEDDVAGANEEGFGILLATPDALLECFRPSQQTGA